MHQAHEYSGKVATLIELLEQEIHTIRPKRKEELQLLGEMIYAQVKQVDRAQVIFVCTHNSRRSQLAELWLRLASNYYGVTGVDSFSGGTEATSFNHRMVAAIQKAGISLNITEEGDNPVYTLVSAESNQMRKNIMFSKKYNHKYNPNKNFIAVMVCSQADQECPMVSGATERMALPYLDPKAYDNSPHESQAYDDKVHEIGREMIYLMKRHYTDQ